MFTYPKILRRKDLKKISKYDCDDEVKDAYTKYLTNYSFEEFVQYCEKNDDDLEDLILNFADLQLEKFEVNSIIWVSHLMINFMIYFNVNLDYGEYYDAYATILQLAVLSSSMKMSIDEISFEEVPFPPYCVTAFKRLFDKSTDFKYNLKNDCQLAYKSFGEDNFGFTDKEFCQKVRTHFDENNYKLVSD